MSNWALPTLTATYTNFLGEVSARLDDAGKMNRSDTVTLTSPPVGLVRWNHTTKLWEANTGTVGAPVWTALATTYAINVNTANAWSTGRTVAVSGDATGTSAAWTGSANISFAVTLATVNGNVGSFGSTAAVPIITVNAKGLITAVTTAALGNMATQAASTVAITGGAISNTAITLRAGTGPTAEGVMEWATATDLLLVGTGAATKTMVDTNSTQTVTGKTINLTSNTLVATSAQVAAAVTDETGSGSLVFSASPTFTGTPIAPTAAAATNTTQIATTAHVFAERANTITLTNKTINLTSNTLTATSAQLAAAVTDETGSGALVFATSPTLVAPVLGTPASGVATNLTGTASGLTAGTATVANGLKSATTTVSVSGATAPSSGQVLTATSSTVATWQTPAATGVTSLNGQTGAITQTSQDAIGAVEALLYSSAGNSLTAGTTYAGSGLRRGYTAGTDAFVERSISSGSSCTGTWRCMGGTVNGGGGAFSVGLFVRVS